MGTTCSSSSPIGNSQLEKGMQNCNVDEVKKGLENGATAKCIDKAFSIVLYKWDIKLEIVEAMFETLVRHGANVHIDFPRVLSTCINSFNRDLIRLVLSKRGKANVKMNDDLLRRCKNRADILRILIESGVMCNFKEKRDEALYKAARNGDDQVVKLLLQFGAKDDADQRALHEAVKNNHFRVVKLLIRHCTKADADYNTLLHSAISEGHVEIVEFLLLQGVKVEANDYYALRLAVTLDSKAQQKTPQQKNKEKKEKIYSKIIDLLLTHGPNDANFLHLAAERNNFSLVRRYIEGGVDVNAMQSKALRTAAGKGILSITRLLINNGAYIDDERRRDEVLFQVAENAHYDVLQLFLRTYRFDVHAFDRAIELSKNRDIIQLLRRYRNDILGNVRREGTAAAAATSRHDTPEPYEIRCHISANVYY